MRLLKRALLILALVVLILIVVGCGAGYWFITKSQPQTDGTLHVAGLKSKVEIVRDRLGITQIYADNEDDLFFAQGYVEAQDRLWQMEYNRRIGHGTLSEMFGPATIKQDRFLRTIGLDRAARADMAEMTKADKQPLEMFSNGVNAFIDTHLDSLPVEFALLGIKPSHWQPVDTVVWGKVMAYNLGGNYEAELLRASLIAKVGPEKAQELMPPYPQEGPFTISPESKNYQSSISNRESLQQVSSVGTPDFQEIAAIDKSLGLRGQDIGSNDWVIDGAKSTTGKPILADDPHLHIQMPSIWYELGLHGGRYDVVGYTFPGVPGIIIGHNQRVAWGVTNVNPDVQDLYLEKINPQNPNQYEYQGIWEDMQVVDEPIKVNNVVSETLQVQITRHGPIMTPVLSGVTQTLALQWTALRNRSQLFSAVLMLDRAQNWDAFRSALRLWDVPSQNFVYADVDGNIGYQMPGLVPIRPEGIGGTVPVEGWTGNNEWLGYVPFDELPFVYNPPTHFVATANQAVVPPTYKYLITADWAAPYRKQRIDDLLKSKDKLSIDDMKAIQGDVYSMPLAELQKYVITIQPEGFLQERALDQVKAWDGRLTTDTVGGTIMAVTLEKLVSDVSSPALGKGSLMDKYVSAADYNRRAILALLAQPGSAWWGSEGRDAVLKKSFAEAVDSLGNRYGDAPVEWRWGRLHTATFDHPLGSVQPLDRLFNAGPVAAPGGVNTVFATSYDPSSSFDVESLSSMRMIVDLSNLGNSLQMHTTGQSGQPLDKHYSDMVLLWRDIQYAPMHSERGALDKVREGLLVLAP